MNMYLADYAFLWKVNDAHPVFALEVNINYPSEEFHMKGMGIRRLR